MCIVVYLKAVTQSLPWWRREVFFSGWPRLDLLAARRRMLMPRKNQPLENKSHGMGFFFFPVFCFEGSLSLWEWKKLWEIRWIISVFAARKNICLCEKRKWKDICHFNAFWNDCQISTIGIDFFSARAFLFSMAAKSIRLINVYVALCSI